MCGLTWNTLSDMRFSSIQCVSCSQLYYLIFSRGTPFHQNRLKASPRHSRAAPGTGSCSALQLIFLKELRFLCNSMTHSLPVLARLDSSSRISSCVHYLRVRLEILLYCTSVKPPFQLSVVFKYVGLTLREASCTQTHMTYVAKLALIYRTKSPRGVISS